MADMNGNQIGSEMVNFFRGLVSASALVVVRGVSVRDSSAGQEQIEPYTNHNLAVPAARLRKASSAFILPEKWMELEEGLVKSAESRYISSPSIHSAGDFIATKFREFGLDVQVDEFHPFESPSSLRNVIGRIIGSTSESILVGAHYDDLPTAGPAPGADDNASGVATLLSVAEALSGTKPKRNIVFVAFSGEEQGTLGSHHFAETRASGFNIKEAIILDQNGNPGTSRRVILETLGESPANQRIIDTLADSMDSGLNDPVVNYHGFGSDHVPLSHSGIPSVLVIESENMKFAKEYGHTSKDNLSNIDASFGSSIAQTVLQAVVRLAMA